MKRIVRYLLLILLIVVVALIWKSLPIISAYGAKLYCSAVFLEGRGPASIEKDELSEFPISLGSYTLDLHDSSVTGSVWGLAKKKAIYRHGLGATLVNGLTESELRNQPVGLAAAPSSNPDTMDWPRGNRVADTFPVGLDRQKLAAAIDEVFREGDPHKIRTRAVVVVYKGQLVGEEYASGFSAATRQLGWSMTKSITSALLGILVKEGRLSIDQPAPVAEWKGDERRSITVADLMHMRSGLKWWEFYGGPSDCTDMLFKAKNMKDVAVASSLKNLPGKVFNYSSGTANILSYIIRETVGDTDYYRWPYEQLFYRADMRSAILEPDAGGTFVGSSYCYATPRDWARFGLLYLHDGIWNGQRILPEGWVTFTATGTNYGALWWLNRGDSSADGVRPHYPHVPSDCYSCDGYEGQNVWVVPSKDLVVVRMAQEHGDHLNRDQWLSDIIRVLP